MPINRTKIQNMMKMSYNSNKYHARQYPNLNRKLNSSTQNKIAELE